MVDNSSRAPRVGIIHERLTDVAGSEQVVEQLARIWPDAPVLVPFSRPPGHPGHRRFAGPHQSASARLRHA